MKTDNELVKLENYLKKSIKLDKIGLLKVFLRNNLTIDLNIKEV